MSERHRPSAIELMELGTGFFDSGHFRELGLSEKAIAAVWKDCPVFQPPSFARPLVRVEDFLAFVEANSYDDRLGDRVRPSRGKRQP